MLATANTRTDVLEIVRITSLMRSSYQVVPRAPIGPRPMREECLMQIELVLVVWARTARRTDREVTGELHERAHLRAEMKIGVGHEAVEQISVAGFAPPIRISVVLEPFPEISAEGDVERWIVRQRDILRGVPEICAARWIAQERIVLVVPERLDGGPIARPRLRLCGVRQAEHDREPAADSEGGGLIDRQAALLGLLAAAAAGLVASDLGHGVNVSSLKLIDGATFIAYSNASRPRSPRPRCQRDAKPRGAWPRDPAASCYRRGSYRCRVEGTLPSVRFSAAGVPGEVVVVARAGAATRRERVSGTSTEGGIGRVPAGAVALAHAVAGGVSGEPPKLRMHFLPEVDKTVLPRSLVERAAAARWGPPAGWAARVL